MTHLAYQKAKHKSVPNRDCGKVMEVNVRLAIATRGDAKFNAKRPGAAERHILPFRVGAAVL